MKYNKFPTLPVDEIKTWEGNPRQITKEDFDRLVDSILSFPQMLFYIRPLVIDSDKATRGGNMRLEALKHITTLSATQINIKLEEMPSFKKKAEKTQNYVRNFWAEWLKNPVAPYISAEEMTEDELREFVIKDNVSGGTWDYDKLANEWDADLLTEWGMDVWQDIENTPPNEKEVAEDDDFDENEQEVPAITQTGDIWQLGQHRLMCGDSTKREDVQALMAGEYADLWLTDPPYNVGYVGKTKDALTIQNDIMSGGNFLQFLTDAFTASEAVMKAGAAFYVWFATREHVNFETALNNVGLHVRQELIWNKNTIVLSRQDYHWKHEPCLYGWKEGEAHYFTASRQEATVIADAQEYDFSKMKKGEMKELLEQIFADTTPTSVINEKKPARSEEHPTMKPVRLFGYQIANSSKKGDIVLDTFGGSGTTIIACEQLGRKARLMELDPHYCDVIIARWEKLTGCMAVKINETTNDEQNDE